MIFFLLLGAHALLKHIYAKHPPRRKVVKKEEGKATDGTTETLKQKLRKALVDYHPDKQRHMRDEDMEWYVLAEEITKYLNGFYEYQKC
jgi:DnaJ-domain-containing protein 1